MKRASWPLVVFVFLVMLFSIGLMLNPRDVPSPLINQPAPSLAGHLLGASQSFNREDYPNQAWLLNVWASWCTGCFVEHPEFIRLKTALPNVVLIGLNYKDTTEQAQAWLAQHGNPYDAVVEDSNGRLGLDWGILGVPETFLIDAQGRVRAKWTGALTEARMAQEVIPAWQALAKDE